MIACIHCGSTAGPFVPGDRPVCEDCADAAPRTDDTFTVGVAGEQIDGTDIGVIYIYVTTPLGEVRMTAEEAKTLADKLTSAAEHDRWLHSEDDAA